MRLYRTGCTDCGWTSSVSRSLAMVERSYRLHSCNKRLAEVDSTRRGRARDAAVDRTPKPCAHKVARHEHGTYAAYTLDRCRCLPCAAAASQYGRDLARRNAYGRGTLVDAEPARQRVRELMAAGVGLKTIVERSGVPSGALTKLMYAKRRGERVKPPSARIRRDTADRLLALRPGDLTLAADMARVDGTGTGRRLRALVRLGWSVNQIAAHLDLDRQCLDRAIDDGQVAAATVRAVAAGYERLWKQPPPEGTRLERAAASRSRRRATAASWPPPAAWDDDTIDDPAAQPGPWQEEASGRSGRRPVEQLVEDVEFLDEALESLEGAAARLGMGPEALERALYRAERKDLVTRLKARRPVQPATSGTDTRQAS